MGSHTCSQCFSTLLEEKLLCGWKTLLLHFDHGCSANTFFNLEVWADTKARFPWSWLQSLVRLIWYDYCWAEVWFGSQTFFFLHCSHGAQTFVLVMICCQNPNVKLHLLLTGIVEGISKSLLLNRSNAHKWVRREAMVSVLWWVGCCCWSTKSIP